MDKIEKIRQEIERLRKLIDDHNYYLDNSEQALGYGLALDDIGQFLDTLSEEPELVRHPPIAYTYPSDASRDEQLKMALLALLNSDLIKVAGNKFTKQDLIDWVEKQKEREEPDKSLEEAAEEKYPVYWKSYPKDGIVRSESSYDTNKQCRDAFIAGAEWQASQMPMPEDTVLFNKGVAEGRRLEREDSVECEVTDVGFNYLDLALFDAESLELKSGDKVKVIVLKDNEDESK